MSFGGAAAFLYLGDKNRGQKEEQKDAKNHNACGIHINNLLGLFKFILPDLDYERFCKIIQGLCVIILSDQI